MIELDYYMYFPWNYEVLKNLCSLAEFIKKIGRMEETRSELFWGETGLKIRPDVFRHDNCERISYLF